MIVNQKVLTNDNVMFLFGDERRLLFVPGERVKVPISDLIHFVSCI